MRPARLAVLLPVARLDKFGYQHLFKLIIKNHSEFSDRVFVLSTSRFVSAELFKEYNNVELVSYEDAWAELIDGEERMSLSRIKVGFDRCQVLMRDRGYDACMNIHINQYVPGKTFSILRSLSDEMVANNRPFSWLYKRYQLRDLLFDSDCRLPWIFNLHATGAYSFGADSIINDQTGRRIGIESGNFRKYNSRSIVDVIGEHTLQDAKEKYEYTTREHRKLNGTLNPNDPSNLVFNESDYYSYTLRKLNLRRISQDVVDETGEQILNTSRDDFISKRLRRDYSPTQLPWLSRAKQYVKSLAQ